MVEEMRLHRFIAQAGVCSRRKAEDLILKGRVSVNGEPVTALGTKVGAGDRVTVDGSPVRLQGTLTLVMYKPRGVLTTMSDERGRKTVKDLLPRLDSVVKPVGRLDKDTEGLLLFTNDGELATRLAHPSGSVEKEYEAVVRGSVTDATAKRLASGVTIEGRRTRPAQCGIVSRQKETTKLALVLKEGRKRQVRLMCEAVGHKVVSLKRIRYGTLRLKGMHPGECRILSRQQLEALKKLVGLCLPP